MIWLIGLSGAGKTAIGREVWSRLRARRPNVVFLDGDMVREVMGNDLGFTLPDRRRNADRICRLCKLLDDQGIDVVCAILSLFHESQAWNRANLSAYFEVFLDVPLEVLRRRDTKGLYEKVAKGQLRDVAGIDLPFAPPPRPDLVLESDGAHGDVATLAARILAALPGARGAS